MAASAGSGLGRGTLAAGVAVAAVAGVVGYQIFFAPGPDPVQPPQGIASDPVTAPEPDVQVAAPETPSPAAPAEPDVAIDLIAPRFDLVRVDAAGGALIAGQAEINADLRLRLDGQEIHLASSDASGDFVAMFDLPPSELPRVLSLEMLMEDGSVLVSEQSVIISPTLRPAEAATGAEVAAAETTGPELPDDSGVTELAMASDPDTSPASGTAPVAPATPDLPEQGGVAAGSEDSTAPVSESGPEVATDASDEMPSGATAEATTAPAESSEAGDQPDLEIAAVESLDNGDGGLTRGLQPGVAPTDTEIAGDPDAQSDAVDPEGPTQSATGDVPIVVVETVDGPEPAAGSDAGPSQVVADATLADRDTPDHAEPSGTDGPAIVAEGTGAPLADDSSPEIATAGLDEDPVTLPDDEGTSSVPDGETELVTPEEMGVAAMEDPDMSGELPGAADAATELAAAQEASDSPAVEPDAAVSSVDATGAADGDTELAMAQDTGDAPVAEAGAAESSGEPQADPAALQPDIIETEDDPADGPSVSTQVATADSPSEAPQDGPAMEPQTPTVLLADSQGIRVIQSGDEAPQVQSQVTLDTIAYDTVGDVVLAGRGPAESDVRFYLDNQPIHLAPINLQGGWRTSLPQVDPGTYTLRLDEVSADGAVQSRIETPFLREEPEAVAAITSRSGENVITVQWGNTLWGIAQQHLGEGVAYVQIYEANRDQIRNPDLIYPGQIFTIPGQDD